MSRTLAMRQIRDENNRSQRASWRYQRASWVIMGVILLATLLGTFGNGPLSQTSVTKKNISMHYEKVGRVSRECALELTMTNGGSDGERTLHINKSFIQEVDLTQILPMPIRWTSTQEELVAIGPAWRIGEVAWWSIRYKPRHPGNLEGSVHVSQGPSLSMRQFIFP